MYADYTHTAIAPNDIAEFISMPKKELLNVSDWLRVNTLNANPPKQNKFSSLSNYLAC